MPKISRHFSSSDIKAMNLDTMVAVYEDQVFGWFIDEARLLDKVSDHAGFVVLHLCLAYLEGHAIYYHGKDSQRQSKAFFRGAFKAVFPLDGPPDVVDAVVGELYKDLRCGLVHTGVIGRRVVLGEFATPVSITVEKGTNKVATININHRQFLDVIERHACAFLMRLRDPAETTLRASFEKAFRQRM